MASFPAAVPPEVGNVSLLPSVVDHTPALNISWEPPTYSLPIAYYRVYLYTLGMSNQTIVTTNGTVVVMEMLDRGVEYEVYIIAVSILGEGRRGELHQAVTHDGKSYCPCLYMYNITAFCFNMHAYMSIDGST